MDKDTNKKGFTIIEVVLVLAIAGLIFMMAFVAFPALQRSQKDTARKNAVNSTIAAISDYMSGSNGVLPTTSAQVSPYIQELITSGYTLDAITLLTASTTYSSTVLDTIKIYTKATCGAASSNNIAITLGTPRQYAVVTLLETGKTATTSIYYCKNG